MSDSASSARFQQLHENRLSFEDTSSTPRVHSIVPCLLCTKPFLMLPFMGIPDQVCPECEKTYLDTARVICRGGVDGRRIHDPVTICRLVPKVLDNGFYIRPRSVLTSSACNICSPGLKSSTLLEITEWERVVRPKKIVVSKTMPKT